MTSHIIYIQFTEPGRADTLSLQGISADTVKDTIVSNNTFLGLSHVKIVPELLLHSSHDRLLILVLAMSFVMAIIIFLVPQKVAGIAGSVFSVKEVLQQITERVSISSGLIINILFFLNFLFSVTIYFYLMIQDVVPSLFIRFTERNIFMTILPVLLGFIILNRFLIWITGVSLGLKEMFRLHLWVNNNTEYFTGLLLLPVLSAYLYTSFPVFIIFAGLILGIMIVVKFLEILIFGIKLNAIPAFHLFLYLCALEIVPLLIAVKWLGIDAYL